MILRPKQLNPSNSDAAVSIMREAGVIPSGKKLKNAQDDLRQALNENGGTLEDVATTLTDLMRGAENENVRISAAKMIATAQGALTELGDAPPPVINISIEGNQGQTAINILLPRSREQVEASVV